MTEQMHYPEGESAGEDILFEDNPGCLVAFCQLVINKTAEWLSVPTEVREERMKLVVALLDEDYHQVDKCVRTLEQLNTK